LGGNGFVEEFPVAMRYREQPVLAVWEGSGNVIALDVLRAMARTPEAVEAFEAELTLAAGANRLYDAHLARTRKLLVQAGRVPPGAELRARQLVEAMALALQASLLLREAPAAVADAFVASRLGEDRCFQYGALPAAADVAAIAARA